MTTDNRRWSAGFVLCAALAVLAWFAPITDEPVTAKARIAVAIINPVFEPLVDLVGREVLVGIFATLALFCLIRMVSTRPGILPGANGLFGGLRERLSRKGDLEGESSQDLSAPPRDLARAFGRARAEPALAVAAIGHGAPAAPAYAPHPLGEAADVQYLAAAFQFEAGVTRTQMERKLQQLHKDDRPLTDAIHTAAMALIDEWNRQITAPDERPAPIAIVRKARHHAEDWDDARSWLGGAPRLGDRAWPRGKDGMPLPFVAQLDCGDLTRACPESTLPTDGSLAFFIGDGAVVYVPPGDHPDAAVPASLPMAYVPMSHPLPERPHRAAEQLFPRWPVDCLRLSLPDDLPPPSDDYENSEVIWAAQDAALRALMPQTRRTSYAWESGPLWWRAGHLLTDLLWQAHHEIDRLVALHHQWIADAAAYQDKLRRAQPVNEGEIGKSIKGQERNRAKAAEIASQRAPLAEFAAQVEGFCAGRDPWQRMSDAEAEVLEEVVTEARRQFEDIVRYHIPHSVKSLRQVCHVEMMRGERDAFAALPPEARDQFNHSERVPRFGHQMFGLGACVQTNLYEHLCDHLLLQIAYDPMVEMGFGDVGIFQFWISPEALAAGAWDKTELTFECH